MTTGRTFSVDQAAKYLGVSAESIRVAARAGVIDGYRDTLHPGGPWRFTDEALDAYRTSKQVRVVRT